MPLSDIHYTLMQVKSICLKKNSFLNPNLWIFLDEDRIDDEIFIFKKIFPLQDL